MKEFSENRFNFNVLEKDHFSARVSFEVSQNLPSFSGHFPGDPILPAVSVIDMSLHLLNTLSFSASYTDANIRKSKFMGKVRPLHKVIITVEGNENGDWNIVWFSESDLAKLASISLSTNQLTKNDLE